MKDLIDKILKYLPQYFLDLGRVFSGPKQFIATRDVESDDAFTNACLFFGISLALLAILGAQHQPPDMEFWSYIGLYFVSALISAALAALVFCISLWVVGGQASAKAMFVTYLYFYGTLSVIRRIVDYLFFGVLKVGDRPLYDAYMASFKNNVPLPDLTKTTSGNIAILIAIFGFGLGLVWSIIAWGAVSKLNRIGKLRSSIAFVMVFALSGPLLLALKYILAGLRPD